MSGIVAEYDLISGCKLGSTEAGGTPISLAYTSDASLLVAVLQVYPQEHVIPRSLFSKYILADGTADVLMVSQLSSKIQGAACLALILNPWQA